MSASTNAAPPPPTAAILPHPLLLRPFEKKVADLRAGLNDDAIRQQAAETLSSLIKSVTIYPSGPNGPEAEVAAPLGARIALAANENSPSAVLAWGLFYDVGRGSRIHITPYFAGHY